MGLVSAEWLKLVLLVGALLCCFISLGIEFTDRPSEQAQKMGLSPQPDALCHSYRDAVVACEGQQGKDCRAEQSQEKNCRDKVAKAYTIANFKCNRLKNRVVDCQAGRTEDASKCPAAQEKLEACTRSVLREYGLKTTA